VGASVSALFRLEVLELLEEAWVENYHSGSTWGPPLWIPYSLMAVGMTLLSISMAAAGDRELRRNKAAHDGTLDRPPLRRREAHRDVLRHAIAFALGAVATVSMT